MATSRKNRKNRKSSRKNRRQQSASEVVLKVTPKVLREYAEELNGGSRVRRWLSANKVENYRVPDREEMKNFAERIIEITDDVQSEAYELNSLAVDLQGELDSRYCDLSEMETLYDLNGRLNDMVLAYETMLKAANGQKKSRSFVGRVARKIGAKWFK
jgi:hypothetical protein